MESFLANGLREEGGRESFASQGGFASKEKFNTSAGAKCRGDGESQPAQLRGWVGDWQLCGRAEETACGVEGGRWVYIVVKATGVDGFRGGLTIERKKKDLTTSPTGSQAE